VAALAQRYAPAVFAVEEIPAAVAWVLSLAEPEDVAVITGSLYLIAEARAVLTGRGFPKN